MYFYDSDDDYEEDNEEADYAPKYEVVFNKDKFEEEEDSDVVKPSRERVPSPEDFHKFFNSIPPDFLKHAEAILGATRPKEPLPEIEVPKRERVGLERHYSEWEYKTIKDAISVLSPEWQARIKLFDDILSLSEETFKSTFNEAISMIKENRVSLHDVYGCAMRGLEIRDLCRKLFYNFVCDLYAQYPNKLIIKAYCKEHYIDQDSYNTRGSYYMLHAGIFTYPELETVREENVPSLEKLFQVYERDTIEYAIMHDDLAAVQKIASSTKDFDFNQDAKSSGIGLHEYIDAHLIHLAAYFGSAKVFKFLVQNGAKLDEETLMAAYQSDCDEIICSMKNESWYDFNDQSCIKSYRNRIFDLHVHETELGIGVTTLGDILVWLNYPVFFFFLLNGARIEDTCIEEEEFYFGYRPLIVAAERGAVGAAEELIARNADVKTPIESDSSDEHLVLTPLFIAAQGGFVDIVRMMLDKGADISAVSRSYWDNQDALSAAAEKGNDEVCAYLISRGANVNKKVGRRKGHLSSCLSKAAICYDPKCLKVLLENGADPNLIDNDNNPLMTAAQFNHPEHVRLLMEHGAHANFIAQNWNGLQSPLSCAVNEHNPECVKVLLEHDAFPDIGDPSPLYQAVLRNYPDIVQMLIDYGADPNVTVGEITDISETALSHACAKGFTEIVRILVENGADINQQVGEWNDDGLFSCLGEACRQGHTEIVRILCENGADLSVECSFKMHHYTPLIAATKRHNTDIVRILLDFGADFDETIDDGQGMSPLDIALHKNYLDIVELFVEYGASMNEETDSGETVFCKVCQQKNLKPEKVIEYIRNGADLNDGDNTPFSYLCMYQPLSLIEELVSKYGADIDAGEEPPLVRACEGGRIDVAHFLIEQGADINKSGKKKTPLSAACASSNLELVMMISSKGADLNAGNPPPIIAASTPEICSFLIEKGCDVNVEKDGKTPLLSAIMQKNTNLIQMLLDKGADIKKKYPLLTAVQMKAPNIVKLLLERGANPNEEVTVAQGTVKPLFAVAIEKGNIEVLKELVAHGANFNRKFNNNTTSMLFHACKMKDQKVVQLLVDYGAKLTTEETKTIKKTNPEAAKLLSMRK